MFDYPAKTITTSLRKILDDAQKYLADITFICGKHTMRAHRAIVMTRAPESFCSQYLCSDTDTIEVHNVPAHILWYLLQYWYTAEVYAPWEDMPIINGPISLESVRAEIETLERALDVTLLRLSPDPQSQLEADLQRMYDEQLGCDVVLQIRQSQGINSEYNENEPGKEISQPAHRFLLAAQCDYFYSMFCAQFCEATHPSVSLTGDLFTPAVLQIFLVFIYTDHLDIPSLAHPGPLSHLQRKTLHKKHVLRTLQALHDVADYLGYFPLLQAVFSKMSDTCHKFKCYCPDCAILLPSMLFFSEHMVNPIANLKHALAEIYTDPTLSFSTLWSPKPFAILVVALTSENSEQPTVIDTFIRHILENTTKHNAVHVLHGLHLCLSRIRSSDSKSSWSSPLLNILTPILDYTVNLVSSHFDFYCAEYPILLSCVDGIGCGFTIDFMDFLLEHIMTEGINDRNAGIIYQGITRDLLGRQEVVKNIVMDTVLAKARKACVAYLSHRWARVKDSGGFRLLDKETLHQLSCDIGVSYRTLHKTPDIDFSSLFGFKPRKTIVTTTGTKAPYFTDNYATWSNTSRGVYQSIRRKSSSEATQSTTGSWWRTGITSNNRPRSRSTESANEVPPIPLLWRRPVTDKTVVEDYRPDCLDHEFDRQQLRSLTDALLPIDSPTTSVSVSHTTTLGDRPSQLHFSPTDLPNRVKSPASIASTMTLSNTSSPSRRHTKWSLVNHTDARDGGCEYMSPVVGARVELFRRPLPTFGTILYIGPVNFSQGTWVGIELESRLGKHNGTIDGVCYFRTASQRGVFVRPDDFKIIALPQAA